VNLNLIRHKNLFVVAAALVILSITGCSGEAQTVPAKEAPPKLVKTITLNANMGGRYREFPAVVEASEDATLAFRVSGELNALNVISGQLVEAGDVLATLDPTDYQIAVDQATANYELAKVQYERSKVLLDKQLASKAGYDEAKAQLQVASSSLKSAKTNLAYTKLQAPFSGQVAQRYVENFESIMAQQPVLSLQKNTVVEVAVQVPEDIYANFDKNNNYLPEVRFDSSPDQLFRAKLKEYDTDADPATNTYKVVFELPRPEQFNALPGMSATLRAELSKVMKTTINDGWNVPASAVFSGTGADAQQSYVLVVNAENVLEKRLVTLDGITDNGFKVTAGLSAGEQLVAAGVHRLSAGETVRIWQKERGL